jgi:hypothetical protein
MKKDFTNLLPQFLQKFPTKLFGGTQQVEVMRCACVCVCTCERVRGVV